MLKSRWLLALPLVLAATASSAGAASIRDDARLFGAEAVRQAEATLSRIERETQLTTTIETIDSLNGESVDDVALQHARRSRTQGIFILIAKQEKKIDVRSSRAYVRSFPNSRLGAIRNAFIRGFKTNDFDAGLTQGVETLASEVETAKAENGGVLRSAAGAPAPRGGPIRGRPRPGGFGVGSLLGIGLAIIAVLFVLRLLGGLMGGGHHGYPGRGPMGMGQPGYGQPGYGAPGYGRGGGFWSSMFGGIGGALAGNWLYDQFSGRHHGGHYEGSSYDGSQDATGGNAGSDDWGGGGNASGDWGGGGDGGGDWGGGGGGDWGGGGGGDWGGGGGGGGDW
jgi:uncharacterized protein